MNISYVQKLTLYAHKIATFFQLCITITHPMALLASPTCAGILGECCEDSMKLSPTEQKILMNIQICADLFNFRRSGLFIVCLMPFIM